MFAEGPVQHCRFIAKFAAYVTMVWAMDIDLLESYLQGRRWYFNGQQKMKLRRLLGEQPDYVFFEDIESLWLRNPWVMVAVSAVLGPLGIDRFLMGEYSIGIIKLVTLGGCGILWILDFLFSWVYAQGYNYSLVLRALGHDVDNMGEPRRQGPDTMGQVAKGYLAYRVAKGIFGSQRRGGR